ncbi:hypothetical protein MA16_Dca021321 [Dendrobium catenatum]|uniref:Reverse transcriptase zinc-binding domain-containing protein n=1 Tax=Dendrobium catenatum TaxID=906689 RepID=A0A2I0VYV9_9ASPA|nr:hypothetical protein MA16_Dca021321 [Dendrobium catenatum]
MWKSICSSANFAKPNMNFRVTVNSMFSLKWDHWRGGRNICDFDYHQSLLKHFPDNAPLNLLFNEAGWVIPNGCHEDISNAIRSIPILRDGSAPSLVWVEGKHCFASFVKDFYKSDNEVTWREFVWHKHYALRYSIFGWLSLVGGLKTADNLIRRNSMVDPKCCFCLDTSKSLSHLFFESDGSFNSERLCFIWANVYSIRRERNDRKFSNYHKSLVT